MHWPVLPLKAIASGQVDGFIDGDWIESRHLAGTGIRYITTGNVGPGFYKEQGSGYISEKTFIELRCKVVEPGDVLISRLNAPIGRACLAPDLGTRVVTSVDNVIVRPRPQFDRRFIVFRLTSPDYLHEAGTIASGATMQRISRSELGNMRVAFPPFDEQVAVATFLDREIAKIDALIAEQEKIIALLAEKRQATISHAVTRGLDPDAPMKDSGVAWLGEVPAHWDVARLKRLVLSIEQGWSPQCENFPAEDPEEWGVLKVGCVNGGVFDAKENKKLPPELAARPEYALKAGDLLISRANTKELVGSAAVVPSNFDRLLLCDKLYRLRLARDECLPDYAAAVIGTREARSQIELAATGASSSMLNIGQSVVLDLPLPMPTLDEQRAIIDFLRSETDRLAALSGGAQHGVALLKERRSALIAAAVTGQIDVREAMQ
ncbi:restriction endonuclease subunit S [Pseudorhodoferax sp. Leaf267]|uniref:restriction endonuclease subunit S n=1 Tax=Pseudorhodoferax sp. Leaf267 TaxID=1736316 RepID=UPI00138EDED8|nr:restriction endonuclease subunit S [Pseudorhodoferax sp. Leaf267]